MSGDIWLMPLIDGERVRISMAQFEPYVRCGIIKEAQVQAVAKRIIKAADKFQIDLSSAYALKAAADGGMLAFKEELAKRTEERRAVKVQSKKTIQPAGGAKHWRCPETQEDCAETEETLP